MEGVKTILVAIDFSQYSPQVLRFAAGLAKDLGAELVAVNVINQRDVEALEMVQRDFPGLSLEKYIQNVSSERMKLLDKLLAEETGQSLAKKRVIKVGVPFKEILGAVQEAKADMLVMGTKGRGNLTGVLFGSTAEKVFRRCPIPLVSVRPEGHFE
jgi:nucleotide-binding universal stress UspA family protein